MVLQISKVVLNNLKNTLNLTFAICFGDALKGPQSVLKIANFDIKQFVPVVGFFKNNASSCSQTKHCHRSVSDVSSLRLGIGNSKFKSLFSHKPHCMTWNPSMFLKLAYLTWLLQGIKWWGVHVLYSKHLGGRINTKSVHTVCVFSNVRFQMVLQ